MAGLRIGDFVILRGRYDIGRVAEVDLHKVRVEYFESVAEPVARADVIPPHACQLVMLSRGARAYYRNPDTDQWSTCRIRDVIDGRYFVRFSGTGVDVPVDGKDLRVRWNRPVRNPLHVLASGGHESGYFYEARIPMLTSLIRQRSASASMPTFLSSAVEIFPHQVSTAHTVLSDPVQRYLLADEVGLGKTIEAGYVIRQTLIDNPQAKITVVCPDKLRIQWVTELRDKFFVEDFPMRRVKVLAHEQPGNWRKYLDNDLVVVDEAHLLVVGLDDRDDRYKELATLAHAAPRLLLLSATPLTSNPATHLGLLHLLDPDLYSWEQRAEFERRYEFRGNLATAAFNLDPDFTPLLPDGINQLSDLLPDDERLADLSAQVLGLLDAEGDLRADVGQVELVTAIDQLRGHLSETYRLHRRTIRHRRHNVLRDDLDAEFLPYEVRGRVRPAWLRLRAAHEEIVAEALVNWRSLVTDALLDSDRMTDATGYAMALAVLASRTACGAEDFLAALRWRLYARRADVAKAELTEEEQAALCAPLILAGETELLDRLTTVLADLTPDLVGEKIAEAIVPVLRRHRRTVLFCGAGTSSTTIANHLRNRFPKANLVNHTSDMSPEASDSAVHTWQAAPPTAQCLLLVDETAENGLNLQAADAVIHLRLPWTPNVFEQRLGRTDRFPGTTNTAVRTPASQYVVLPSDTEDTLAEAWLTLLTEGYGIFDGSVSTVQDAIAEHLSAVWTRALVDGPAGFAAMTAAVRTTLRTAAVEIDKMDLLESIYEPATQAAQLATNISMVETHWRDIEAATLKYTGRIGGIGLSHRPDRVNRNRIVFDILDSKPIVDPRIMRVESFGRDSAKGVFNRNTALRMPGTRIFRKGNPLMDMLANVAAIDDRGQAVCFWRPDPRHRGETELYFGFDFLVQADLHTALLAARDVVAHHPSARKAIRRQADALFPPFMTKVWVTTDGNPVTDAGLERWLDQPYHNQRDVNLDRAQFAELVALVGDRDAFRRLGEASEACARTHFSDTTELSVRSAAALRAADQRLTVVRTQIKARAAAGRLVNDDEALLLSQTVTEALAAGIAEPKATLVAATCLGRRGLPRPEKAASSG